MVCVPKTPSRRIPPCRKAARGCCAIAIARDKVVVGVAFPAVGTFLLSFVPLPEWVDKRWVRLAMLAAVAVIPAIVGAVSILMLDRDKRPRGAGAVVEAVMKGYPYTVGLATTLAMMTVFAPIRKIRTLAKRWTSEHVPVIVNPEDYPRIVDATQHPGPPRRRRS